MKTDSWINWRNSENLEEKYEDMETRKRYYYKAEERIDV